MSDVLHGLLRPKLILWMDWRFLILGIALFVLGAASWPLWIASAFVFALGITLGKISPYYLDEIAAYMRWRLFAWDGMIDDEGHCVSADMKMIEGVRKVTT